MNVTLTAYEQIYGKMWQDDTLNKNLVITYILVWHNKDYGTLAKLQQVSQLGEHSYFMFIK
jgi:hypothetical protein